MRHDFDDGKYTVIFDEKTGKMEALRHGEPWQDLSGNNLVYFMLSAYDSTRLETAPLQAHVAELEAALSRVQKLTEWEAPDADSGAALNFNQGYESALEDVAAALKP